MSKMQLLSYKMTTKNVPCFSDTLCIYSVKPRNTGSEVRFLLLMFTGSEELTEIRR